MIIKSDEFQKTIEKGVVLVDFFATWCGPCKMLAPILENAEKEIAGKAKICKLDVDEAGDIAQSFGIMSVPTMIIFKDGVEVERMIGLRQQHQILDALNKQL